MASDLNWLHERDPASESTSRWSRSRQGQSVLRGVLDRIAAGSAELGSGPGKHLHPALIMAAAAALVFAVMVIPLALGLVSQSSNDVSTDRTPTSGSEAPTTGSSQAEEERVHLGAVDNLAVPSLVGVSEPDALKTLEALGLEAELRWRSDSSSDVGTVIRTDPPAGTPVLEGALVIVEMAGTLESIDEETHPVQVALKNVQTLIDSFPGSFVGHYVDGDALVVVLNPGVAEQDWAAQFNEAAAPALAVRFTSCNRSGFDLMTILEEIAARDWSPDAAAISLGLRVDPRECAVLVAGSGLTDGDVALLTARYGDAVTFDRTATPSRLPLPHG